MLNFVFQYRDLSGTVAAQSVAQALDRVKIRYLEKQGITTRDPSFRLMKSRLIQPWRLNFTTDVTTRFQELYRSVKDGVSLGPEDKDFFTHFSKAAEDLNRVCPKHLRPRGMQ